MNSYVVELSKLKDNIEILRNKAGDTPIWGVVKGNGYGFGTVPMAKLLSQMGKIRQFAVTALEEAQDLRENGFGCEDILMLRATADPEELKALVTLGIICTVGSLTEAKAVDAAAQELGLNARVHVKIDTGMGRYGFLPEQYEEIKKVYAEYPRLKPEGIFTHFHTAGNEAVTKAQFSAFKSVVERLKADGISTGMAHCCNSLAFWHYPEMHMDAVRLGSCLLGRIGYAQKAGLHKLGYVEAEVEAVRTLPKGHNVGYGGDCKLKRETTTAVVSVGYYHGFAVERGYDVFRPRDCIRSMGRYMKYMLKRRHLQVEINGKLCPVLGHVGMVNLIADVTDVPCKVGDPVVVQVNPLDLKGIKVVFR